MPCVIAKSGSASRSGSTWLAFGNPGQHRTLAGGVCELKNDHGPGYRVYYTQRGSMLVILLCGGEKHGQQRDIRKARALARQLDP